MDAKRMRKCASVILMIALVFALAATGFAAEMPEELIAEPVAEDVAAPQAEEAPAAVPQADINVVVMGTLKDIATDVSVIGANSSLEAGDIGLYATSDNTSLAVATTYDKAAGTFTFPAVTVAEGTQVYLNLENKPYYVTEGGQKYTRWISSNFKSPDTAVTTSTLTLNVEGQSLMYALTGMVVDNATKEDCDDVTMNLYDKNNPLGGKPAQTTEPQEGNYGFGNLDPVDAPFVIEAVPKDYQYKAPGNMVYDTLNGFLEGADFYLETKKATPISGQILDKETGIGIGNAQVKLTLIDTNFNAYEMWDTTNPSGNYTFGDDNPVYPGVYKVTVSNVEYTTLEAPNLTVTDTAITGNNYTLEHKNPDDTYTLTGTIFKPDQNTPLGGISVELTQGETTRSTVTTADGKFAFANLPNGKYDLIAFGNGYYAEEQKIDIYYENIMVDIIMAPVTPDVGIEGGDSVYIGKKLELKASLSPRDIAGKLEWKILDSSADKASVDQNGVVTGLKQGVLKVYATFTADNGEVTTAAHKISVKKAMSSFDIKSAQNRSTLYKGGKGAAKYPWHTQLVTTNVRPSDASKSVKDATWKSSDPKIATVVNGKVKVASGAGTKLGTVRITATDKGSGAKATYTIRVVKAK